jgi:hypothetical protein
MNKLSITQLRNNIYQLIDQIIRTGEPLLIERNGKKLLLTTVEQARGSKLQKLKPHHAIQGDPQDLVNLQVYQWKEENHL